MMKDLTRHFRPGPGGGIGLPQPKFHWLELSHMRPLSTEEVGKCSLPVYPGGKENWFGEHIS